MAIPTPSGYRALGEDTLGAYLEGLPDLARRLGGTAQDWTIGEVGDGNLNLVFIVEGPAGSLCVKQALPYVRLVGESWPLPLDRASFEHAASVIQASHAPGLVPVIHHYDPALYLIVMERLSPHVIMRRGMIEGIVYPRFLEQITDYLARTLYFTSDLAMGAADKKAMIARFCPNTELCRITEDLVFTDPYRVAELNRWTSPWLDDDARAVREDAQLKRAVSALKLKFLSEAQALLHGDLHTGSIMVTDDDTRVIDPEFAFVGPMGFDVGKLIGELLLSFFSQRGHERAPGERDAYRSWILDQAVGVWRGFERKFKALWDQHPTGAAYPRALFAGPEGERSLGLAQEQLLRRLFADSLGFAGAAMIRRTLGLAHNIDMERIDDPELRAACERRNLRLAREIVVGAGAIGGIEAVAARARQLDAAAAKQAGSL